MEIPYIIKLALREPLSSLLAAKQRSDVRDYSHKHKILRSIMSQHPDDFAVDSIKDNIAGITHRKTGFKIHIPINQLPTQFRSINVDTTR